MPLEFQTALPPHVFGIPVQETLPLPQNSKMPPVVWYGYFLESPNELSYSCMSCSNGRWVSGVSRGLYCGQPAPRYRIPWPMAGSVCLAAILPSVTDGGFLWNQGGFTMASHYKESHVRLLAVHGQLWLTQCNRWWVSGVSGGFHCGHPAPR